MTSTESKQQLKQQTQQLHDEQLRDELLIEQQLSVKQQRDEQLRDEQLRKKQLYDDKLQNGEQLREERLPRDEQLKHKEQLFKELRLTKPAQLSGGNDGVWRTGERDNTASSSSSSSNGSARASSEQWSSITQQSLPCHNNCGSGSAEKTKSEISIASDVSHGNNCAGGRLNRMDRPVSCGVETFIGPSSHDSTSDMPSSETLFTDFKSCDSKTDDVKKSEILERNHNIGNKKHDIDLVENLSQFCDIHGSRVEELLEYSDSASDDIQENASRSRLTEKVCPLHHEGLHEGPASGRSRSDDAYSLFPAYTEPSRDISTGSVPASDTSRRRNIPDVPENPVVSTSANSARSDNRGTQIRRDDTISNSERNNNSDTRCSDRSSCDLQGILGRNEAQNSRAGNTVGPFNRNSATSRNQNSPGTTDSSGYWLQYVDEKKTCLLGCMNSRAGPHRAYQPTEVEHIANIITHALWIVPSIVGLWWMTCLSSTQTQQYTALIYGMALFFLFSVSAIYHILAFSTQFKTMKYIFHIGDRATIYMFIAASYTPWLLLKEFNDWEWIILSVVWCAAFIGIIYQYTFHERFKMLETILYVIIGVGPAIIIVEMEEPAGLFELFLGGMAYIFGLIFFKADGIIPFAHAIWHLFVFIGAACHFCAICRHLLGTAAITAAAAAATAATAATAAS